jgi:aspartate/methionine/tyrosine aminotransferase
VIDMSMGNPDEATPAHIVAKLIEVAQRSDVHQLFNVERHPASEALTQAALHMVGHTDSRCTRSRGRVLFSLSLEIDANRVS